MSRHIAAVLLLLAGVHRPGRGRDRHPRRRSRRHSAAPILRGRSGQRQRRLHASDDPQRRRRSGRGAPHLLVQPLGPRADLRRLPDRLRRGDPQPAGRPRLRHPSHHGPVGRPEPARRPLRPSQLLRRQLRHGAGNAARLREPRGPGGFPHAFPGLAHRPRLGAVRKLRRHAHRPHGGLRHDRRGEPVHPAPAHRSRLFRLRRARGGQQPQRPLGGLDPGRRLDQHHPLRQPGPRRGLGRRPPHQHARQPHVLRPLHGNQRGGQPGALARGSGTCRSILWPAPGTRRISWSGGTAARPSPRSPATTLPPCSPWEPTRSPSSTRKGSRRLSPGPVPCRDAEGSHHPGREAG